MLIVSRSMQMKKTNKAFYISNNLVRFQSPFSKLTTEKYNTKTISSIYYPTSPISDSNTTSKKTPNAVDFSKFYLQKNIHLFYLRSRLECTLMINLVIRSTFVKMVIFKADILNFGKWSIKIIILISVFFFIERKLVS